MMSTKKTNIKPPATENQMQDQHAEDRSMLLIEQEARELISCGRLVRDAPGASVHERKRTDILFSLLSQVESEGSASISNLDGSNVFNASTADDSGNEGKLQWQKVRRSINRFVEEHQGRIRKALLTAAEKESMGNLQTSFSELANWDFAVPCPNKGCNHGGIIHSSRLIKKTDLPKMCDCGSIINDIGDYDLYDDKSNAFHFVSRQVAEAILTSVCTNRRSSGLGFTLDVDGDELPIVFMDNGKRTILTGDAPRSGRGWSLNTEIDALNSFIVSLHKVRKHTSNISGRNLSDKIEGSSMILRGLQPVESQGGENGAFYSPVSRVRDELAHRLSGFRRDDPLFQEDATTSVDSASSSSSLQDWAQTMSIHILYALEAHDGLIEIIGSRSETNDFTSDVNSLLMLSDEGTASLDLLVRENDGLLTAFFTNEMAPPMICEPVDWSLSEKSVAEGGYVSEAMRKRAPFITREALHLRLGRRRYEPTQELIETLNMAQKTRFKVNQKMLDYQARALLSTVEDIFTDSVEVNLRPDCVELRVKEGWTENKSLLPDPNSLDMWLRQIKYSESLVEDPHAQGGFYHPLRLDHRGRMYTNSTLLDPQGDDFSRGLLSLGESRPLTSQGWKWLCISVSKLWEGTTLGPEKNSTFEQLLSTTRQEDSDFVRLLKSVAADPLSTIDQWSKNRTDIIKSHSEGFQRLSATIAYVEALTDGGVGANSDFIAVQDASSNIYQHISLILRDRHMANLVNVLEGDHPKDVYQEVANVISDLSGGPGKDAIEELGEINNLPRSVCIGIIEHVSTRSHAKSPVMTKGYGSHDSSIEDMMLSHNGKPGRKQGRRKQSNGKFGYVNLWHGKEDDYLSEFLACVEEAAEMLPAMSRAEDDLKSTVTVNATKLHPDRGLFYNHRKWKAKVESIIHKTLGDDESRGQTNSGLLKSCKSTMSQEQYSSLEKLVESIKSPFRRCAHPQSTLMRILDEVDTNNQVDPSDHENIAKIIAKTFSKALEIVIPNYKLKKSGALDELLRRYDTLSLKTVGGTIHHLVLLAARTDPVRRRNGEINDRSRHSGITSKRINTNERDGSSEGRAIAPNFVHSLDAEHMRFVARGLIEYQRGIGAEPHIWMVHDAFGCHPNDIDAMRKIAAKGLFEVHKKRQSGNAEFENILDELHAGKFFTPDRLGSGIGTLDIEEIREIDTDNWYFLS